MAPHHNSAVAQLGIHPICAGGTEQPGTCRPLCIQARCFPGDSHGGLVHPLAHTATGDRRPAACSGSRTGKRQL